MVVLQPGYNIRGLFNNDRFLVMCLPLKNINATTQELTALWKVNSTLRDSVHISFSTLRDIKLHQEIKN